MALKTLVFVSGVNNLSDARYCAGMGVELMGFNFNPNDPDHISEDSFKEIAGWISGVAYVGEFGDNLPEYIINTTEALGLDYIEVDKPNLLVHLKSLGIPVILKIDIAHYTDPADLGQLLNDYEHSVTYFNLFTSGSFTEEYWIKTTEYMMNYPIILGYNITAKNINYLIDSTKLEGISLKGGNELKPGYKDFDELAEILEAIEIDDTI